MTSKHHAPNPGPCPKCRGTLVLIQDQYGSYLDCMNCGTVLYQDWLRVIVDDGLSATQTAERFGVSVRTIYRVLNGCRPGSR